MATDPGSCINTGLASENDAHVTAESDVIAAARAQLAALALANLASSSDARIPIVPALVTGEEPARRRVRIEYIFNTSAGGALFGGDSDDGTTFDSEFGPDLRHQSGSLVLHRTDDGSDPATMTVSARLQFHYDVQDALDFCPGNSLQSTGGDLGAFEYNFAITSLSRLEASGMAHDVRLEAHYNRSTDLGTVVVPRTPQNPQPPQPPQPAVTFPQTGPARTTGSLLRVRTAPSLGAPAVRLIGDTGTEIQVLDQVHGDRVQHNGVDTDVWDQVAGGFVSHAFVEFIGAPEVDQSAP